MPAGLPLTPAVPFWRRALDNIFALDVRSLALMRIGIGVMMLWDLADRYPDLTALFSDEGVLPRALLPPNNLPLSIHLLGGSTLFQAVLFYFEGFVALAL